MSFHFSLADGSKVYREFCYPAGERQIRINQDWIEDIRGAETIAVTARIPEALDPVRLALLKSAIESENPKAKVSLMLPYLPYSRADRRFQAGDCFGLQAYATLLNSVGFSSIVTLDAHSDVAQKLIHGLVNVSPARIIERAILRFAQTHKATEVTVLFPDAGAAKRYSISDELGCNTCRVSLTKLFCTKKRDPSTGALSGFSVPNIETPCAIIVDDICDGGGTFLGIAKQVHPEVDLGLYVTHGIFSKGIEALAAEFSDIFTTDSIPHASEFTHLRHEFSTNQLLASSIT